MSLNVTLTITSTALGQTLAYPVNGSLFVDATQFFFSFPSGGGNTTLVASGVVTTGFIPAGSHSFDVDTGSFNPDPSGFSNFVAGTFSLKFNDTPQTIVGASLRTPLGGGTPTGTVTTTIKCLHGSSLIQMRNESKRLDQIKEGDEVLTHDSHGNHAHTQVKGIIHCWLSFMGVDHDAIIFEPGSLGENEPSQQLIIDPGHPMCTKQEYLEKGYSALRPAGTFWEEFKGDKVYTKKWTDIFIQNEPSVRYDLILEEPFNTYIANGMIVRSRGYKDHRYKEFV